MTGVSMSETGRRQGAIAVIVQNDQLLVIERSATVRAPGKVCFPGGGIERGETEEQALVRELREELNVAIRPLHRLWQSRSASGIELFWWQAALHSDAQPRPNPREVARFCWMTPKAMAEHPQLLQTNSHFLSALAAGHFELATSSS